jgi:DNA (cytosine-5)-methyltransferase 1
MKKITIPVFSAFAGYDSQFLALRQFAKRFNSKNRGRFHIEFDLVGWCEIDPDAIASHNALFPEYKDRHYKDITKIVWKDVPYFAIFIYSFCCQDISRNGSQAGLAEGSGTRSSLVWYVLEGIRVHRPKYTIMENVAALLEKTFCNEFCKWQEAVDELGYRSSWGTMLASDFGIPQNRNRAFMVSVKKDIKQNVYFPEPLSLNSHKEVECFLDDSVNKLYYYPEEDAVKYIVAIHGKEPGAINTIHVQDYGKCIKRIVTPTCNNSAYRTIPTLLANAGYFSFNYKHLFSTYYFPVPAVIEVWESPEDVNIPYADYIASAIEVKDGEKNVINASKGLVFDAFQHLTPKRYFRLRHLTPSECFRFMGVDSSSVRKLVSSSVSREQLVKQAGNAIVVDVLYHLYQSVFTSDVLAEISTK